MVNELSRAVSDILLNTSLFVPISLILNKNCESTCSRVLRGHTDALQSFTWGTANQIGKAVIFTRGRRRSIPHPVPGPTIYTKRSSGGHPLTLSRLAFYHHGVTTTLLALSSLNPLFNDLASEHSRTRDLVGGDCSLHQRLRL